MAIGKIKLFRSAPKRVAKSVKKFVKKAIRADKEKNYVLDTTAPGVTTAGAVHSIHSTLNPNADDDPGNLNGRMGYNQSIETHLTVTSNTNVLNVLPTLFRFIMFKWKGFSDPTVADVLSTASPQSSIQQDSLNAKAIHILYDRLFNLDPATANSYYTSNSSQSVSINRSVKNKFEFDPTVAYVDGSIWYLGISDQGTYTPTATINTKLVYTE